MDDCFAVDRVAREHGMESGPVAARQAEERLSPCSLRGSYERHVANGGVCVLRRLAFTMMSLCGNLLFDVGRATSPARPKPPQLRGSESLTLN